MLYVKSKINGEAEITIPINYDNVYTCCPKCGVYHKTDIAELLRDGGFDLEGSVEYCEKCSWKGQRGMNKHDQ